MNNVNDSFILTLVWFGALAWMAQFSSMTLFKRSD